MKVLVSQLKERDVVQLTPTLPGVVGQIYQPNKEAGTVVYVYFGIYSGLHPGDRTVHPIGMKLTDEVELIARNIRQRTDYVAPHRCPPEPFWGVTVSE
jgi:hypothetical protein